MKLKVILLCHILKGKLSHTLIADQGLDFDSER